MYLIWLVACQESVREGPVEDVGVGRQSMSMQAVFGDAGVAFSRDGTEGVVLSFRGWGLGGSESVSMPMVQDDGEFVRYQFSGVEEWWTVEPGGIRQGWTVSDWPAGNGELVFDVGVSGADVDVEVGGAGARFIAPDGPAWNYSGPKAWDADGVALDAWLEAGNEGVRVVVDADGAALPVTVDPLMTTASWTVDGANSGGQFGTSVASAGDVNGDGFDDVVVWGTTRTRRSEQYGSRVCVPRDCDRTGGDSRLDRDGGTLQSVRRIRSRRG